MTTAHPLVWVDAYDTYPEAVETMVEIENGRGTPMKKYRLINQTDRDGFLAFVETVKTAESDKDRVPSRLERHERQPRPFKAVLLLALVPCLLAGPTAGYLGAGLGTRTGQDLCEKFYSG